MRIQRTNQPSIESGSRRIATLTTLFALGTFQPIIAQQSPDSWKQLADMPTARQSLATCTLNGIIYAVGGYPLSGQVGLPTVEAYDSIADSWVSKADMNVGRIWPCLAAVSGKLYVIGGGQGFVSGLTQVVEDYDPTTDKWSSRHAYLPTPRLAAAAVVVDGKIYVIGGLTSVGPGVATVEAFDPVANTWEEKAPMPTPRGLLCAAVVDGKIYAIGGSVPLPDGPWLNSVEMYDPAVDKWTRKADMPTPRGGLACGTAHGRIYVVGGRGVNSSSTLKEAFAVTEEYNPETDTWKQRMDMPVGTTSLAASEVNNRIHVFGGTTQIAQPTQGVASVFAYTPPLTEPALRIYRVTQANQSIVRFEWLGRSDCTDSLQFRSQADAGAWTAVQSVVGADSMMTVELPQTESKGFFRVLRDSLPAGQ